MQIDQTVQELWTFNKHLQNLNGPKFQDLLLSAYALQSSHLRGLCIKHT